MGAAKWWKAVLFNSVQHTIGTSKDLQVLQAAKCCSARHMSMCATQRRSSPPSSTVSTGCNRHCHVHTKVPETAPISGIELRAATISSNFYMALILVPITQHQKYKAAQPQECGLLPTLSKANQIELKCSNPGQ